MKDTRMIIGDVGGTNCRLASCDPLSGRIEDFQIFAVRDFKSLGEVIQVFKESHSSVTFHRASIAIANPIVGDMIKMTNAHWAFSIEQTRKSCGLGELLMLNDWEAVALALPHLTEAQLRKVNQVPETPGGNKALLGVGTGLGAAGLVRIQDSSWVPVAGEGGHVSFCPTNKDEIEIFGILRNIYFTVSTALRFCSWLLKTILEVVRRVIGTIIFNII